jgi:hypothetical protein
MYLPMYLQVRLSGLAQHEWELDADEADADAPPPPPSAPMAHIFEGGVNVDGVEPRVSYQTVWLAEPRPVPSVARFAARPCISTLLEVIDGALSPPNASAIATLRRGGRRRLLSACI